MSKLHAYWEVQREIAQLEAKLSDIAASKDYQTEKAVYEQLCEIAGRYGKTLDDVVSVLVSETTPAPQKERTKAKGPAASEAQRPKRQRRPARSYRNPYTGEVIKTRNPRNRALRQWMEEYGPDVVASWGRIQTDAR